MSICYKKFAKLLFMLSFAMLFVGCMRAPTIYQPFAARDINDKFESGFFIPKTEILYVILDSSASMDLPYLEGGYQGMPLPPDAPSRFGVGREIIKRLTHTLPEMDIKIAVSTFGYGSCMDWENTRLNYALQPFSLNDFEEVYSTLDCTSGGTPIHQAIKQAEIDLQNNDSNNDRNDLNNKSVLTIGDDGQVIEQAEIDLQNIVSNNINVLIISDGEKFDDDPLPAINDLKASFGNRLCLDAVWVGEPDEDDPSKQALQSLTDAIGCGQTYEAKNVASPKDMATLVKNVFLTAVDTNEDGVPDFMDNCPGSVLEAESATGQKLPGYNACSN